MAAKENKRAEKNGGCGARVTYERPEKCGKKSEGASDYDPTGSTPLYGGLKPVVVSMGDATVEVTAAIQIFGLGGHIGRANPAVRPRTQSRELSIE